MNTLKSLASELQVFVKLWFSEDDYFEVFEEMDFKPDKKDYSFTINNIKYVVALVPIDKSNEFTIIQPKNK